MRTIYAALLRFEEPATALPAARAYTRRWVSQPWGGWPRGQAATEGAFTADDDSIVSWRTLESDDARLWELRVDEAFPDDASMRQETLLQVGGAAGDGFALVRVAMRSTDGTLTGAFAYENTAPEVVPTLVSNIPCEDGGRRLTTGAWSITRAEEPRLARLVDAPSRRLPVLLLVADAVFGDDQADAASRALAGLAHVAVVERDRFGAMVERTGIDAPPGASAYLWWAPRKGHRRRPQWFRGDAFAVSQWGTPAWPVIRTIYGAAAFRLSPPALAAQLEAESTLRRIRAVEASAVSSTADAELLQAWEADLVALERAQRQNALLELENERVQNDLNALLAAFDVAVADASRSSTPPEPGDEAPGSLAEAVKIAAEQCDALVFLPEATRSAAAWRFNHPDLVLAALRSLDHLSTSWQNGELDGPFIVAARSAGLPWRSAVSRTAQTQYRSDYIRRYDGREVMLGPHLAWGNSPDNALRIYLFLDREKRTVVVGHVGRHLRDTSNPHL